MLALFFRVWPLHSASHPADRLSSFPLPWCNRCCGTSRAELKWLRVVLTVWCIARRAAHGSAGSYHSGTRAQGTVPVPTGPFPLAYSGNKPTTTSLGYSVHWLGWNKKVSSNGKVSATKAAGVKVQRIQGGCKPI